MNKQNTQILKAERMYAFLLALYPSAHQRQYRALMLQTFRDHYRDYLESQGTIGLHFWRDVISDEITSILREHLAAMQGGERAMNKYMLGLVLGIMLSVAVVLTNVVFPGRESDAEYGVPYPIFFLGLFFLFGVGGYFASKAPKRMQSGAVGGAVTAFLSIGLTMLTFIMIDNLFLDIVSQQPEKIWGFQHQQAFHTMRAYVNDGLLRGVLIGLPIGTLFGALLGAIGGGVRALTLSIRAHSRTNDTADI